MSLIGKWFDLIREIATGNLKTKILFTVIAAILFLSLVIGFIFLSLFIDNLWGFPKILNYPWNVIMGMPLITVGFIIMLISIIYFVKVKGTPVPFNPPPVLITTGPYKYARNPMLTGIFMQLFGIGFHCHSITLVFIFTPLFIFLNIWELKNIEEPELEKCLGQEYLEYKSKVPMFLPKVLKCRE